ncbi:MAG: twin-arginine translocation signal domain-containing protein, partial [Sulfitobacter sp.]
MTRKPEGTTDAPVRKDRRDFLKFAGSAAPLAAVAVATTGSKAEAAQAPDLASDRIQ